MKKALLLSVLSSAFVSQAFASKMSPLVVYGEDNRTEVYEASEQNQLLAKSTATMISKYEMTRDLQKPGSVQLTQNTLKDWLESSLKNKSVELSKASAAGITFCDGTRFISQPNPGMCSGFLIAPDLMVTAGHCTKIEDVCEEYRWVFDFQVDKNSRKAGIDVPEENIYKCKKIVSATLDEITGRDYGVIQLDRPVTGRKPLEIASQNKIADNQSLVVIGSPSGLPLKVAGGAKVRSNSDSLFFVANTDTFQGNSGSAVFNADTGVVEGILVRGEEDYVPNFVKRCVEVNVCNENDCRGEDISRMTSIPEVASFSSLIAASMAGNTSALETILSKDLYVDFNLKDGQSALIKAAAAGQNESLKTLLTKGADVNKQDAQGSAALHELSKVLNNMNADALITLVDAGAKLELKNTAGDTALLVAAKALNLEGVKLLIKSGADKNATDARGENVAQIFLRQGNKSAAGELADLGIRLKLGQRIKLKLSKLKKIVKR